MNDSEMTNVSASSSGDNTPRASFSHSFLFSLIIAVSIALVVRFYIAAPFIVSGSSMEDNFFDYNYLIVDRLTYNFVSPQRGDVIVLDLPQNTSRSLIKRIIGLPGETVVLQGDAPTVTIINATHPKGFTLSESYISPQHYGGLSNTRVTLGVDQYFVLGDNRRVSADSRIWGILPRKDIVGRVFIRLYPLDQIGILPAQAMYSDTRYKLASTSGS